MEEKLDYENAEYQMWLNKKLKYMYTIQLTHIRLCTVGVVDIWQNFSKR